MVKQRAGNKFSRFFRFDDERHISRPTTTTFRGFSHSFVTSDSIQHIFSIFTQHTMPIF